MRFLFSLILMLWTLRAAAQNDLLTIPVVVHVLWNETGQNINEDQIRSQLIVLNDDFRALNWNIGQVETAFANQIADMEIEFCLASIAPDGSPTNGIERQFTPF